MRRKSDVALLRKIAIIRNLQCAAAQAHTVRASAELKDKTGTLSENENVQKSGEEGWADFLTSPSLQLEIMPSWSAVLRGQQKNVRAASTAVREAESELKRRTAHWHDAEMRSDGATEMAQKAARDRARHHEEVALQDASDRHIQRKAVP